MASAVLIENVLQRMLLERDIQPRLGNFPFGVAQTNKRVFIDGLTVLKFRWVIISKV
jgi:hypothetical protein